MRLNSSLGLKLVGVAAAALLLAACATTPPSTASTSGAGTQQPPAATPMQPMTSSIIPGSEADLVKNVGDRVFFAFNKSNLSATARATLQRQAAWLKKYSSVTIRIEGNCDERGTQEYNLALGNRRAHAAKAYLVNLGVAASRIATISYGKERPVALGHDEAAWAQNRNAITVVTSSPSS
jgi:peptidoglycan-associated lipoprotein